MSKKGEHGLPWVECEDDYAARIEDSSPPPGPYWIADFANQSDARFVIACTKALDGKKPEALDEAVEAARYLATCAESLSAVPDLQDKLNEVESKLLAVVQSVVERVFKALADFEGEDE